MLMLTELELNLTAAGALAVGVALVLWLQPRSMTMGTAIAAAAAFFALVLPPTRISIAPPDLSARDDEDQFNLTAALSLLAGVLGMLSSDPARVAGWRGTSIAIAAAASVLLLPPMPTPSSTAAPVFAAGLVFCWFALRRPPSSQRTSVGGPAVSHLFVHPVKSCAGVSQESATLDRFGFEGDRRLMVVNATSSPSGAHAFLTQRQLPRMALISCSIDGGFDGKISFKAAGVQELVLRRQPAAKAPRVHVRVWDDDALTALDMGDAAAKWLSRYLGTGVRLVSTDYAGWRRPLDDYVPLSLRQPWRLDNPQAAFHDGYPTLLISADSLKDLNSRLAANAQKRAEAAGAAGWFSSAPETAASSAPHEPLGWDRFRPNIVVHGTTPFEEDTWKRVRIGGATFRLVKGCSRCKITTTDQRTAVAGAVKGVDGRTPEPLATLQQFREMGTKGNVYFGQNLVHEWPPPLLWRLGRWMRGLPTSLSLQVGDAVEVLERGEPVWDRGVTAAE